MLVTNLDQTLEEIDRQRTLPMKIDHKNYPWSLIKTDNQRLIRFPGELRKSTNPLKISKAKRIFTSFRISKLKSEIIFFKVIFHYVLAPAEKKIKFFSFQETETNITKVAYPRYAFQWAWNKSRVFKRIRRGKRKKKGDEGGGYCTMHFLARSVVFRFRNCLGFQETQWGDTIPSYRDSLVVGWDSLFFFPLLLVRFF